MKATTAVLLEELSLLPSDLHLVGGWHDNINDIYQRYTPCPRKKGATDFFAVTLQILTDFHNFRAQLRKTMPKSLA